MKHVELSDYVSHKIVVEDSITGFKGQVIGHADYITGCDKYLVQPRCNDTSMVPEGQWIDEARLEILYSERLGENALTEEPKTGGDINPPNS